MPWFWPGSPALQTRYPGAYRAPRSTIENCRRGRGVRVVRLTAVGAGRTQGPGSRASGALSLYGGNPAQLRRRATLTPQRPAGALHQLTRSSDSAGRSPDRCPFVQGTEIDLGANDTGARLCSPPAMIRTRVHAAKCRPPPTQRTPRTPGAGGTRSGCSTCVENCESRASVGASAPRRRQAAESVGASAGRASRKERARAAAVWTPAPDPDRWHGAARLRRTEATRSAQRPVTPDRLAERPDNTRTGDASSPSGPLDSGTGAARPLERPAG